jgi:competence ComEA-like helix-hairpin-helix protein
MGYGFHEEGEGQTVNGELHWSRRAGFIPAICVLIAAIGVLTWRGTHRPVYLDSRGLVIGSTLLDVDLRLNVNRAGAAQLQSLPQIGPALAERIVADRQANGAFANLDDVQRVSGMGPRTLERIRPFVVCGE